MIPLQHKNEFKLTAEELEAAITPKTKILVMPFPVSYTHLLRKGKTAGLVCLEFIMKKSEQQPEHLGFRNFIVLWMRILNYR